MNAFDYLAVLISIVLGLGITNLLGGFAGLVRQRGRLRMYWPLPLWMGTLFLIHVQMWWAMFELRELTHWTFIGFLAVIMQPVTLFLASAILVPDIPDEGPIDLHEAYVRERRWFFAAILALLAASLIRTPVLTGNLTETPDLIAHGVFGALAATSMFIRNDAFHKAGAISAVLFYGIYVGLLFLDLA